MRKKVLLILILVLVVAGGAGAFAWSKRSNKSDMANTDMSKPMAQSQVSYKLNLMNMGGAGGSYPVTKPTQLMFDIRDQNNKVFKDFAIDNTKLMHLIVVRKDRTNFQHVHPAYDANTGMFTMNGFQFPTNGDYRVFSNFAPTGAKKDSMGMVETEAPYQDVKVGDLSKYTPQPLGQDSLTSTVNGFTASIAQPPGGDSVSSTSAIKFYAGQDGSVPISIEKSGQLFTNLQEYLGSLGHMVVLGPNLEFIHAHPIVNDINNQTGYIQFMVTFPVSGQYKLYLQTQADNQVTTNDLNLTVLDMPKSGGGNDGMSGMNM